MRGEKKSREWKSTRAEKCTPRIDGSPPGRKGRRGLRGCWEGGTSGVGVKLVPARYWEGQVTGNKLYLMWAWLVFVVSSLAWVQFLGEMAKCWKLETSRGADPLER